MAASVDYVIDRAREAEQAIHAYDEACETVSACTDALVALQQERALRKTDALYRLCQQPHPVNPAKPYSLSQAEDVLQLDPEYAAYKARVAEAEAALREAVDAQRSALLMADLRIAQVKAEAGVR